MIWIFQEIFLLKILSIGNKEDLIFQKNGRNSKSEVETSAKYHSKFMNEL